MLSYIWGFLQGTVFGAFVGFLGGILTVALAKPYINQIKDFVEKIFEAL